MSCIRKYEHDNGFIDYITLSSSIMFSMKYATDLKTLEKETLYNNIRTTDYPDCQDYLDGLTVTSCDYKEVFGQYKDNPNVVFLVDPPYLSTDAGTYKMRKISVSVKIAKFILPVKEQKSILYS